MSDTLEVLKELAWATTAAIAKPAWEVAKAAAKVAEKAAETVSGK